MKTPSRLLRVPEVAQRLAIRESTVRKMLYERRLPSVKIGRVVSIPEEAIEQLILEGYRPTVERVRS